MAITVSGKRELRQGCTSTEKGYFRQEKYHNNWKQQKIPFRFG